VAAVRPWVPRGLTILVMIVLLDLVIQYLLGLLTNVYAPAMFTSNSSYGSLNAHIFNGMILFLVSIVMLIFAALMKQWRCIVPAVVLVVSVYLAGSLGMVYINTTPNPPLASFGMGTLFLVAFVAGIALAGIVRMRPSDAPHAPPVDAAAG
jgi:hypothetical protein